MRRRLITIVMVVSLLTCSLASGAEERSKAARWSCVVAGDATARKLQVEKGMLPRVVFTGETQPASIEARMAHHKTPALSVAVVREGKLDWSAAWGRLAADGARAGCDSLFQAGSIAKPVTLLATLRMKEKGLVDFDKSIETYLSSYHLPNGRQTSDNPVTLRNLFAHTAGITPGGYLGYAQGEPLPTDQQIVRGEPPSNSRKIEVLNAPGASLIYSGGGYTVIEIALQDHLRKPFDEAMREWVIDPAGMRQATFTQPPPVANHERTARGHKAEGVVIDGGWRIHPEQAAAGLWATASDLAAVLMEMFKGYNGKSTVFTKASIDELIAKPIEGHLYGFRVIGEGDQVFITHYGGTQGYRAGMTLNLRTGNGAAYLTNSDNGDTVGAEFFAAVSRTYGWSAFRETQVTRVRQSPDVLRSLTGAYAFGSGRNVTVKFEDDALALLFPNGDRYVMDAIAGAPRRFIHAPSAVEASFDGEGAAMQMRLYGQTGSRVEPEK